MPATACFPGVTQQDRVEVGIHGFRARLEFFVEESRFHLGLCIAGAVMQKLHVENPLHEEDGTGVEVQPGARLPHHHVIGVWVQEDSGIPPPTSTVKISPCFSFILVRKLAASFPNSEA